MAIASCGPLGVALLSLHATAQPSEPANIGFVKRRPKLADIGMITLGADGNTVTGTPRYMPPDRRIDKTADTFALAKALAENRRAEGHATAPPGSASTPSEGGGEARDELRQLVHELYGLHLPDGAEAPDARTT